ncbi:MAG: hypothetical protein ACLFR1_09435 [Spirochaetia bacterium]
MRLKLLIPILFTLAAMTSIAQENDVDERMQQQLDSMEFSYEIDQNNDFRFLWQLEDERTQLLWISSSTYEYMGMEIREVWSPAIVFDGPVPEDVANRVLQDSYNQIIGSWYSRTNEEGASMLIFAAKIPAEASNEYLGATVSAVIHAADAMEAALTDGEDQY